MVGLPRQEGGCLPKFHTVPTIFLWMKLDKKGLGPAFPSRGTDRAAKRRGGRHGALVVSGVSDGEYGVGYLT